MPDPRIAELDGDLHYLHGDWDAALASYAEACSLGDAASPRLARKRGIILYLRGRLDEADEVYAAARLDGTDPAEEAQVLAWRAAVRWVRSDVAGCEELIEPAEAAATASGDDAALAAVHTTRAMIAAFQADRRANEWSYRKALEHAERAGDVDPDDPHPHQHGQPLLRGGFLSGGHRRARHGDRPGRAGRIGLVHRARLRQPW